MNTDLMFNRFIQSRNVLAGMLYFIDDLLMLEDKIIYCNKTVKSEIFKSNFISMFLVYNFYLCPSIISLNAC